MKLYEALQLKSQLEEQIANLSRLVTKCCQAQAGEKPPLDPNELFQQYEQLQNEVAKISTRLQITNHRIKFTYLDREVTMTEAIAEKENLERQQVLTTNILEGGIISVPSKWDKKEIPDVSYVDVDKYKSLRDELVLKKHALRLAIQKANYESDLV